MVIAHLDLSLGHWLWVQTPNQKKLDGTNCPLDVRKAIPAIEWCIATRKKVHLRLIFTFVLVNKSQIKNLWNRFSELDVDHKGHLTKTDLCRYTKWTLKFHKASHRSRETRINWRFQFAPEKLGRFDILGRNLLAF